MSTIEEAPRSATQAKLGVRKGSRAAPLMLLLLTVLLFVNYALPSGVSQMGHSLGLISSVEEKLTLEKVAAVLKDESKLKAVGEKIKTLTAWQFVTDIVRPLVKVYLDRLAFDFGAIIAIFVKTVAILALYSLIPGLAGLLYRRNFLVWFLVSFAMLATINATGFLGSLGGAEPMPGSGAILIFVLSQLALLIVAYRLRRHSQGLSILPAKAQNWGLTVALVLVGIACWQGWGPGYSSGPAIISKAAAQVEKQETAPAPSPPAVAPPEQKSPAAEVKPAETPALKPARPPSVVTKPADDAGPRRSWIWSFLGTGVTGWIYKWEFILIGLPLIYTFLRNSAAWTSSKPKNIVICLDGTSNTPDQMEMGFLAQTNVFKLFSMLKADKQGAVVPTGHFDASLCKRYGARQIGLYYAGVGNKYDNDPLLQTFGMAMGMGAGDIVERAYLDLVRVYKPGDRVFIFGFSRGAAISRLLARAIDARGVPRTVWTLRLFGKHRTLWSSSKRKPAAIDVLGCWDTVGSFGVAKTIAGINFQQLNLFKDLTIPDNVAQAYHMLALDEMRDSFEPTLMDPDPIRPERIVEVWFSGDHANIGGGWATDKLSDVTLDFLLRRISSGYATEGMQPGDEIWGLYLSARQARKEGLVSSPAPDGVPVVDPDSLGQVRSWFSNLYIYRPRKLPLHAVLSETVFDRMTKSIPVYAPQSLFDLNDALDEKRDLIEAKIGKLSETNSLTEGERKAVLEFKDKLRLTRFPQYWESLVAARSPRPAEVVLSNAALNAAPQ